MRDIQDLLREKEHAIEQVRAEVDALRSATLFLSDRVPVNTLYGEDGTGASTELVAALRTVAPLLVDETDEFDPGIRARLIAAAESDYNLGIAKRISRQLRHIAGLVGPRLGSSPRADNATGSPQVGQLIGHGDRLTRLWLGRMYTSLLDMVSRTALVNKEGERGRIATESL